ncbi:ribbon-helix-helix domain-containing protein [Saccharolobus sp. A20]|uniref:ribbon-helix-helix domain-containing protein n=2 Tax=Sulfolobaceae TaxID=118883 RepID=UPI002694EFD0
MIRMQSFRKVDESTFELEISSTITISFKLEDEFLNKIDSIARDLGYTSRSDFIRDAILEYLRFLKQNDNNRNTG